MVELPVGSDITATDSFMNKIETKVFSLLNPHKKIVKSVRGRHPKLKSLQLEIKQHNLSFEEVLTRIAESGDIQAEWASIMLRCGPNRVALKKERRKLLNRIQSMGYRLLIRVGLPTPTLKRGEWSQRLFVIDK